MIGLNFPRHWMWSEAIEMLDRAERLHREMFRPVRAASRVATWEPPVDVMETESAVIVLVALPGVEPGRINVSRGAPLSSRTTKKHPLNKALHVFLPDDTREPFRVPH